MGVGFEGPLSAQEPIFRIPKASGPRWADREYSHMKFLWLEPLISASTLPVKTKKGLVLGWVPEAREVE